MTPDGARALLSGTTPGPWQWRVHEHTPYSAEGPSSDYESLGPAEGRHALETQDAENYSSWVIASDEDKTLIAAAPDLATTIASMRTEWAVEVQAYGRWESWCSWTDKAGAEEELDGARRTHPDARLMYRCVGPSTPA